VKVVASDHPKSYLVGYQDSELQQLWNLLDSGERELAKMDVGHCSSPEKGEEDHTRKVRQEEAGFQEDMPLGTGLVVPDVGGGSTAGGDLYGVAVAVAA
jgi:hypothetical protein